MKDKIKQLIITREPKNIELAHALCIGNGISFSSMLFDCNDNKIIGEAVQLEAVKQDGYVLQYCSNPSEAVQLEAVKENGYALQYCIWNN